MKAVLLACLWFSFATNALAHRLDEYLQAVRISVTTNRIEFSIDLTPGVGVADQVMAVIDKDHDGQISEHETAVYAQRMLNDLRIKLDDKVMTLSVVETSFPSPLEMKAGIGVIRIKANAPVTRLSTGNHVLQLANTHLPAISVYLVNALATKDPVIQITKQIRDELQKDYRLEFGIVSPTTSGRNRVEVLCGSVFAILASMGVTLKLVLRALY